LHNKSPQHDRLQHHKLKPTAFSFAPAAGLYVRPKNMTMKSHKKTLRILVIAVVFAVVGACIDFYYEWPVRVPGDPPSSLYTYRTSFGVNHGWILYFTDDVFAYDDLIPGFGFSIHTPIVNQPFGTGGWIDFSVVGIAPWFIAACVVLLSLFWAALRYRAHKAEQIAVADRDQHRCFTPTTPQSPGG